MLEGVPSDRIEPARVCLSVGLTAHRDLVAADEPRLRQQVRTFFLQLQAQFPDLPLRLMSALAEGGDQLVAEEALALGRTDDWLGPVDVALAALSWDKTFDRMKALIDERVGGIKPSAAKPAMRQLTPVKHYDVVIVGAGFAGSVMAERLAADAGKRVLVIDKRPHIAGNAYDHLDEAGLLIHQYGPHIFHTNSAEISDYLSRFTEWRFYEHRVIAVIDDMRVPMPINRTTLNMLYGLDLETDEQAEAYYQSVAEPVAEVRTSRDVVVGRVSHLRDPRARLDEASQHGPLVDDLRVVLGVRRGRDAGDQGVEVGRAAHPAEVAGTLQVGRDRDGVGRLTPAVEV